MELVDGHHSRSQMFIHLDYLFSINRRQGDTIYFICRHRGDCPGRAVQRNGVLTITTEHNHEPDLIEVEHLRFMTALRRRSRLENTALATIFREEERRYPRAAREMGGLRAVLSTMKRARRHGTPVIPGTLLEYAGIIRQQNWFPRYGADLSVEHHDFFRGHVVSDDGSLNIIFMSETVLQYVRQVGRIRVHMDATFKVVPRGGNARPLALQFFTIHVLHDDMTFPLLYSLMERKTRSAYTAVMRYLRQILANVVILSVMADYESAMRMAVISIFPGTNLRGCWFHFARAVFKKSRELGLQRPAVQEATRPVVRAAMALPLLPNNIMADGIPVIEQLAAENGVAIGPFVEYLRRQWLPLNISVHGEHHRTNNSVEAFHRQLYRVVERPHPNIWVFTERLQEVEFASATDLTRLRNGAMLPPRRRRRYLALDQRIRRAEERLAANGNIYQFLRNVRYGVDRLERQLNNMPDLPPQPAADPDIVPPILPAANAPAAIPAPPVVAAPIVPAPDVVAPAVVPAVAIQLVAALPAIPAPPVDRPAVLPVNELAEEPVAPEAAQPAAPPVEDEPRLPPCLTCLINPREFLMVDCRHLCVCSTCILRFRVQRDEFDDVIPTRCPICRTPITTQPIRVHI